MSEPSPTAGAKDNPGAGLWIHPKAERLPTEKPGAFVILSDGSLLTVTGPKLCISRDDGRCWGEKPLFQDQKRNPSFEFGLLRTWDGVIVLVYMDLATKKWGWNSETHQPIPDARVEVWTTRSLDEGQTWAEPQRLFDGWCGAIISMIQTRSGYIIAPIQRLLHDPGRHAQVTYVSSDNGQTWRRSNILDFGGHGHHDGACEGTMVELRDGRIWMLLRTNLDRFWQAYSEDNGLNWRTLLPSTVDTSSAPGYLTRLTSGRLMLAWNRLYPEGLRPEEQARYPRTPGDCEFAATRASVQREELSIAFSEDDGKTWSTPVVLLRQKGKSLAYPFILERRPGDLWVTTRFRDKTAVRLSERDWG
ncbi:MAG: exo-alpha-sialidase [Planctomycetes bacterium]|nr:exo-alpha-sialidase [Planctomycetota bacterium]